jgi:hypothetical protein
VEGEVVQAFEELAVIPAFIAPARAAGAKQLENRRPVLLGHLRQHRVPPVSEEAKLTPTWLTNYQSVHTP